MQKNDKEERSDKVRVEERQNNFSVITEFFSYIHTHTSFIWCAYEIKYLQTFFFEIYHQEKLQVIIFFASSCVAYNESEKMIEGF